VARVGRRRGSDEVQVGLKYNQCIFLVKVSVTI
jgi:hypothetical protein